jgi:transcriptional regulator PpsR
VSSTRDQAPTGRNNTKAGRPAAGAFLSPKKSLEDLDAQSAASLIEASSDIALVLDRKGVIQDVSMRLDGLPQASAADWIGKSWADVVTVESRPKVESLLGDVASGSAQRWRHINHPVSQSGGDLPILYSAVPMGEKGRIVAFGRDLRPQATLQQRLVDAQQTLERDFFRLRHVQTRYRLLFDLASEAILIVDAGNSRVVEANPAAIELLGLPARKVAGSPFPSGLNDKGQRDVVAMLARVRTGGRGDEIRVRTAESKTELQVSATLFAQEDAQLFLVRVQPVRGAGVSPPTGVRGAVPDGFVVTDLEGRVLLANHAFVELAQLGGEEQLRGQLARPLARPPGCRPERDARHAAPAGRGAPVCHQRCAANSACRPRSRSRACPCPMATRPAWASRCATSAAPGHRDAGRQGRAALGRAADAAGRAACP